MWTDSVVSQLAELWTESGLSASQIGKRLGVTRNAVIGKVSRLGLAKRQSDNRRAVNAARRVRKPRYKPPVTLATLPPKKLDEPNPLGGALLDVRRGECLWPTDAGFCRHAKSDAHPSYCPFHAEKSIRRVG